VHRALEISKANPTPYISENSGIESKKPHGTARSRHTIRAVTLIEQSPQPKPAPPNKISAYATGSPNKNFL